jgi:CubicO group peptidase (beta-lactamase class C family)
MQYCNFNYSLLGEIVRRVTGDTLDAAMRRYLFEPIGMTSSAMIVDDDLRARLIERPPGIPLGPDHAETPLSTNHPLWEASDDGASGVFASVVDLARFWQMFLDGGMVGATRVLSRDAVRVMTTNQIPGIEVDLGGGHRMWRVTRCTDAATLGVITADALQEPIGGDRAEQVDGEHVPFGGRSATGTAPRRARRGPPAQR